MNGMSYGKETKVRLEEFCSEAYINRVREAVDNMFTALSLSPDYRRDRLLVDITREICLSRM